MLSTFPQQRTSYIQNTGTTSLTPHIRTRAPGTLIATLEPRRLRMLAVRAGKRGWWLMISSGRNSDVETLPCECHAIEVTSQEGEKREREMQTDRYIDIYIHPMQEHYIQRERERERERHRHTHTQSEREREAFFKSTPSVGGGHVRRIGEWRTAQAEAVSAQCGE
jgi:hypothetical protein